MDDGGKMRLYRSEKVAMLMLMSTVSSMTYAQDDLKQRLETMPDGAERMKNLLDTAMKFLEDVRETIPDHQRMNLVRTATEYEIRMVPKLSPKKACVVVEKEDLRVLVDGAQEARCTACVLDGKESRGCRLAQALENVLPMEEYDGVMCAYNMAPWEN